MILRIIYKLFSLWFKYETFKKLSNFHALVATQFSSVISVIQCDNGGEFDNNALRTFTNTHGVLLRFSCPHTSQQIIKVERTIRVNDIVCSLLFQAHMLHSLWVEALHAYYHLKVFGFLCYPNTSATMSNKLAPHSIPTCFSDVLLIIKGISAWISLLGA